MYHVVYVHGTHQKSNCGGCGLVCYVYTQQLVKRRGLPHFCGSFLRFSWWLAFEEEFLCLDFLERFYEYGIGKYGLERKSA